MAFTGTATIKKITDKCFRITGLSLAGDASGTIGFSDKTVPAGVSLPASEWQPYASSGLDGGQVSLQDAVRVTMNVVTDVTAAVPISVVKTGTKHTDFVVTLHNDSAATVSAGLEIYVEFHG